MSAGMHTPNNPPLCADCKHFVTGDVKYEAFERCAHPAHGVSLVDGRPIQPSCARQRSISDRFPVGCGKQGRHFEEGAALGPSSRALAGLPKDLFRTLQRAAHCLDLYIDGLTAAEVVDRYTALGGQITLDFAARLLRESASAGSDNGDVSIAKLNEGKLPVGGNADDSAGGHKPSVSTTEGGSL